MITPIIPREKIEKNFFHTPFFLAPKKDIFAERAIRFRELAEQENSEWKLYLQWLAVLSDAQQYVLQTWQENERIEWPSEIISPTVLPQAPHGEVPPSFQKILHALLNEVKPNVEPSFHVDIDRLLQMNEQECEALAKRVLDYAVEPNDGFALVIWIRAALQIIWTAWAATLSEENTPPVVERASCPCCGTDAVGSVVLGSGEKTGVRYMHCPMCNSRWNALRAKCPTCGKSNAMSIQSIAVDADAAAVSPLLGAKAESCDECNSYHKLYRLDEQQYADPIADDLASLAVDMLMGEAGYLRAGENPFLLMEMESKDVETVE